jgi:hypothetical protein
MPTLAKAQLIEPESPWGAPSEEMYQELCRDRRRILIALGFYEKRDLPVPEGDSEGVPTTEEERELLPIAGALAAAAVESTVMPTAVLVASLLKVSKKPSLFFTRELPAPVERAIAGDYQRGYEQPGIHWRDVWGDQVARFPGEVEEPTEANIAKAARAAIATIQEFRKPGRTPNGANQILADRLGEIFRGSGKPIRRSNETVMRNGKVVYVEGGGPFHDFLELVLKPLQPYLWERGLQVTAATIVRLVTDGFPPAQQAGNALPDCSHSLLLANQFSFGSCFFDYLHISVQDWRNLPWATINLPNPRPIRRIS